MAPTNPTSKPAAPDAGEVLGVVDGIDLDTPASRDLLARWFSTAESSRYGWAAGHDVAMAYLSLLRGR